MHRVESGLRAGKLKKKNKKWQINLFALLPPRIIRRSRKLAKKARIERRRKFSFFFISFSRPATFPAISFVCQQTERMKTINKVVHTWKKNQMIRGEYVHNYMTTRVQRKQ